jgi:hypothetical protein
MQLSARHTKRFLHVNTCKDTQVRQKRCFVIPACNSTKLECDQAVYLSIPV